MKYMYLGQLLQGDVQLVLHVLHLLLKIADLDKIANSGKYSFTFCSNIQMFIK